MKRKLFSYLALTALLLSNIKCSKESQPDNKKSNDSLTASTVVAPKIIYTDINPDTVLYSGAVYNLDINNDGIADFTISNNKSSVELSCLGNNEVLIDSALNTLSALSSNINIGATGLWKNSSLLITSYTSHIGGCGPTGNHASGGCTDYVDKGPFPNQAAAFLGLRIHKGLNTYYAWARLTTRLPYITGKSVPLASFIVSIQDYAYNSGTGLPILAGQMQ